jgi:hypothetical protein
MKFFIIFLFLFTLSFNSEADQNNILMYGGGNTQVTSELNEYRNIVAGRPIIGTIMVTHDSNNAVDIHSFRLGNQPLQVELIQSARLSSYSPLEITTYRFQLDGLTKGIHTLAPVKVNVGGKDYQAAPLVIEVTQ